MRLKKNNYFLILIILLVAVFWIWWLPGARVANDFSFISNDWLKLQFDLPRAWNERGAEGLGEYSIFILWSYPINLIFGVLTNLGLNFVIWERILVVIFIILGSVSIWKFLGYYFLSNRSRLIGSFFYLVNTYPILLIDGGQISIALAYALFPLSFLLVIQSVHANIRKKILAGLIITLLGFFDIRFIFIIFLLIFLKSLFDLVDQKGKRLKIFWQWIVTGIIISIVILTLNFFWLFANFKIPIGEDILSSFTKISTNFLSIGHPLLVVSPHWYKNIFGNISELRWQFVLLPVLVFAAAVLKRKDKVVAFWLIVAIVAVFLAKGGTEPLPLIYPFLHSNIPGFSFFRDSTKFFFLVTLSYALLISISSEEFLQKIFKSQKLQFLYIILIIGYLLYLVRPVFLNQMTGTFSIQPNEKPFNDLANYLGKDNNFGRVFWIPTTAPLSYSDLNHPIIEAARVFNRIPFRWGVKGSYETFNFLREAPYMGEVFDIAGISHIVYPYPDIRKEDLSSDNIKYYYTFLSQLSNLNWIEQKKSDLQIPLLKTKNHQEKIFAAKNSWVVFGTDEVFKEATKSSKLRLANNAIFFAEDKPEMGLLIAKYPEARIVFNRKTIIDLTATFFPKQNLIFPAKFLTVDPDQTGWWKNDGKDLISWRSFLQTKYNIDNKDFDLGGGWSVGEGNKEHQILNTKYQKGAILFARVMESSKSGRIKFYQDNKQIGEIITRIKEDANVRWFKIGELQSSFGLTIKTEGDINIINALAVIDPQQLLVLEEQAASLLPRISEFKEESTKESKVLLSYQKINPTKYKIFVSGLTNPTMIIFSATYHPLWKLNGQPAVSAYGFLNGFRVDRNGEYILEFEPEKFIYFGMTVSVASLAIWWLLLVRLPRH